MWYFLAYAVRNAAFYLSLPVAGRLLAADEVGRFFYLLAIVNLASVAATLGMGSYITRKAYSNQALSYAFVSACTVASVCHAVVVLGGALFSIEFLTVGAISCIRALSLLGETYLLASGNKGILTRLNWYYGAVFLLTGLGAAWLFRGAEAFLVATAVADLLIIAASWVVLGRQSPFGRRAHRVVARVVTRPRAVQWSLRYGLPVLLASLANLGLNSFDRFVVKHYLGFEELATFSLMYTLAFASSRFVGQPLNQVSAQLYMRARASAESQAGIRRQGAVATWVIAGYTWLAVLVGNQVLGIVGDGYVVDSVNFGLVGLSAVFALLFSLCSLHLKRAGRTVAFAMRIGVAAVTNVVLSVWMVPRFGILGASVSTFVAYALLFLSCWRTSSDKLIDEGSVLAVLVVSAVLLVAVP